MINTNAQQQAPAEKDATAGISGRNSSQKVTNITNIIYNFNYSTPQAQGTT